MTLLEPLIMSQPIAISRKSDQHCAHSYGTSPLATSPAVNFVGSLAGTSPPSRTSSVDKQLPHAAAKKWLKRLKYDPTLDSAEFMIGFMEAKEQPERRSGAEAWSMRVHNYLVELSHSSFVERFKDDVPFHRIAYIKHAGTIVWDAEQSKRVPSDAPSLGIDGSTPPRRSPFGSVLSAGPSQSAVPASSATVPTGDASDSEDVPVEAASLPEACWMDTLQQVSVRELCMLARVNRWLRQLASTAELWQHQYEVLFGEKPSDQWNFATLKRLCRRSELRAARWLEAEVVVSSLGSSNTTCLQMDASKVVSCDGSSVRLWSYVSNRRLASLSGHPGRVTTVAFDDDFILSGCSQAVVKVWGMDDLKCVRTLRGHGAAVTAVKLAHGFPLSAAEDATLCLWDVQASAPIVTLELGSTATALAIAQTTGDVVAAGWELTVWDLASTSKRFTLETADEQVGRNIPDYGQPPLYSAVSVCGNLLAAGGAGKVCLWDLRNQERVGTLAMTATDQDPLRRCVGVQLDDWKLVESFADGTNTIAVHDIRCISGNPTQIGATKIHPRPTGWLTPVQVLAAPAKVHTFEFFGTTMIAGLEGMDCMMWNFTHPREGTPGATFTDASEGTLGTSPPSASGANSADKNRKKKPAKVSKKQTRYPKRTTK